METLYNRLDNMDKQGTHRESFWLRWLDWRLTDKTLPLKVHFGRRNVSSHWNNSQLLTALNTALGPSVNGSCNTYDKWNRNSFHFTIYKRPTDQAAERGTSHEHIQRPTEQRMNGARDLALKNRRVLLLVITLLCLRLKHSHTASRSPPQSKRSTGPE